MAHLTSHLRHHLEPSSPPHTMWSHSHDCQQLLYFQWLVDQTHQVEKRSAPCHAQVWPSNLYRRVQHGATKIVFTFLVCLCLPFVLLVDAGVCIQQSLINFGWCVGSSLCSCMFRHSLPGVVPLPSLTNTSRCQTHVLSVSAAAFFPLRLRSLVPCHSRWHCTQQFTSKYSDFSWPHSSPVIIVRIVRLSITVRHGSIIIICISGSVLWPPLASIII